MSPTCCRRCDALYYEIASTTSAFALRSLQELADPTHILWGSDLPFVYGARLQEEIDHWQHYDGFDAGARAAVEQLNALQTLPALGTGVGATEGSTHRRFLRGGRL